MGSNGIKLKKLKLLLSCRNDQVPQQFELINSSESAATLEALEVNYDLDSIGKAKLLPALASLFDQLASLTTLNLVWVLGISFVVDIFQYLTMLEHIIHIDLLVVVDRSIEQNGSILTHDIIKSCKLKHLEILLICHIAIGNLITEVNQLFSYILQSCPRLESFRLFGSAFVLRRPAALNLSFVQNPNLKHVDIHVSGCKYFIFNNNEEKRWKCYNDKEETIELVDNNQR